MNKHHRPVAIAFTLLLATLVLSGCASLASQQERSASRNDGLATRTAGLQKNPGFFTFYWDDKAGKVWLEIDRWDQEFIYVNYLARGLGSNDLGLDRGQIGNTRIVKFQRVGPRVLLVEPNYAYRAISESASEQRAIEESFATSVLWSFKVEAASGTRVLVDASEFFQRDAHGVGRRLGNAGEGSYTADADRSIYFAERSRAFPNNTEVEYLVTFKGEPKGRYVQQVTPTPEAISVHMHHSFVALPDDNYQPRVFDPRSGYFGISFQDYASPIDAPLTRRYIARHRLAKKNPSTAVSEAVEPIVYYLDPGAPSPIREALLDGARWWAEAFEALGYKDAFRVELLPDDADPLDVRYNVIQWVHRATRGWSYGASVIDPRTGEIIKGHVSLGSLRVRQDFLLAQGLLTPFADSGEAPSELSAMALARLRQLSAHEVGHTLGLAHNFAASTQDRASVMDYPHPLVVLTDDGEVDISKAYDTGVGPWDRFTIEYGYQDFAPGTEVDKALASIVAASLARGQLYMVDEDARLGGDAQPVANLWDNGSDAVTELERLMRVRAVVLNKFSEKNIAMGTPLAALEEALVPMYLLHRYQAEAAAKQLGGQYYSYAMRGDGQVPTRTVEPDRQRAALDALLATLAPDALLLPASLLAAIPGRPPGYPLDRETFARRTGATFDAFSPAETAANLIVSFVLHPHRANRLVNFHALDPAQPGLGEILDTLIARTWRAPREQGPAATVQQLTEHAVLDGIMRLAVAEPAGPLAREQATSGLVNLAAFLGRRAQLAGTSSLGDHYRYGKRRIDRFLEDPQKYPPLPSPQAPPGSPIGGYGD